VNTLDELLLATPDTPPRRLYPLNEVKAMLGGLSTSSLYRRFNDGSLPTVHVGGRRFVRAEDLDAYVGGLGE
jgi:predicted DNA-binding transcriptional regulator AlpA